MNRAETILVVEDEEVLLDLVSTLLISEGFSVLTARDGAEALRIFSARRSEISLVLSDMGLPVHSGWEVYQRMKEIDPNVKVILATGYQSEAMKQELLAQGAKDFVSKPYVWDGLVKRIREVIAAP
jgi:two-component system, cell cycle sensor histidine kinase and response regulator CckA